MAVATARPNFQDVASGGKQGTPPEPMRKRYLPDYGPLSTRIVHPTGKYLFSPEDELPSVRVGRGRKMTSSDFQIVTMYSDLSRRDIGYLQSIARVYDVTQMRELIQCRLNHMGRKRRCLDVTRHEDYAVYGGYLEKKYGGRMPELMPMIHSQQRRPKPWPRVTEYPTVRPRPRDASMKINRQSTLPPPKLAAQEQSRLKESVVAIRGSDEGVGMKSHVKTSTRKAKAAEKPEKVEQKPVAEKVVRKSEPVVPSGPSTKRTSKPTPAAHRKTKESKDAELATGVSSHENAEAQLLASSSVERGDGQVKDAAKKLSSGEVGTRLKDDKSIDFVDMFCSQTEHESELLVETVDREKAGKLKRTATPGRVLSQKKAAEEAKDQYADEKFETESVDETPEIAKSMSLGDLEGIFTPEYDEAAGQTVGDKGRKWLKGDQEEKEEDVEDRPAGNVVSDDPAEEMDEETVKRLEKSPSMAPVWLFEDDGSEDDKIQVFPRETSPFQEQETMDSAERYASSADEKQLSKDRSSAKSKEDTVSRGGDGSSNVDDQQEETTTPETRDLTTSGDEEDYDSIHEVPSCIF